MCLKVKYLFYILGLIILLESCNTTEKLPNKIFHNLTARYNPYFLAKKRIDSLERALFYARKDNYNRVLEVITQTDTTQWQSADNILNLSVKQIAIVPNRHENSDLLDASYLMLGKIRFYMRDFDNATGTLKYINTKGKNESVKQSALIELMRLYLQSDDFKSAGMVLNTLQKMPLENAEKHDFLVMRAHYFRRQDDYVETGKSLGSALRLMKRGEVKARIYFLQGQIYQRLEKDELAYVHYKKVLKNNPSYELSFYAKLYLAQVSGLGEGKSIKKINRYFKKLLKDIKNKEYQDKIYYEMALFELRQKKTPEAIRYLHESVQVSNNSSQKAYSFLKLGEIHYGVQQFESAKNYYDSTMASLPQNDEQYKTVKKRQEVLTEFVKHLNTYRTQDSLQRLAKMSEPALEEYLQNSLIASENRRYDDSLKRAKIEREKQAKAKTVVANTLEETTTPKGNIWYFYNPKAVQQGQQEFVKKWGKRPLEDNWRLTDNIISNNENSSNTDNKVNEAEVRAEIIQTNVAQRKKAVVSALPKTEEDLKKSNAQIEEAAFELGKIYRFKLEEPQNAIQYFEDLLNRFPATTHEPEVLYYLYQLYQKQVPGKESDYSRRLTDKYPNSIYARLIGDPEYLAKMKANEGRAFAAYKKAYELYENMKYPEATASIDQLLREYPVNPIQDKIELLQMMIAAKTTQDKAEFKRALETFKEKYPESTLKVQVAMWLEKLK
jgi:tetratricopeptide (TPR) repeat protein